MGSVGNVDGGVNVLLHQQHGRNPGPARGSDHPKHITHDQRREAEALHRHLEVFLDRQMGEDQLPALPL
jgi:hypothetical protein